MVKIRLAQELWDEIIDCLAARPSGVGHLAVLRSASLINRSCVGRAQSYIFYSISLGVGQSAETVAARLRLLMTLSPHLIQYVHKLEIQGGGIQVWAAIAAIPWSHVDQLILNRVGGSSIIIERIGVLAGLRSLRSLILRSIVEWEVSDYSDVIRRATGVRKITFVQCGIHRPKTPWARDGTVARPTYLGLSPASPILSLLFLAEFPVDLSQLAHIHCTGFTDPRINTFLRRISGTVTRISVNGRDQVLTAFDVTALPLLTQLDVFDAHQPFNRLLSSLPKKNRISVITLITYGLMYDARELESLLLGGTLPNLQNVNVQVLERPPEIEARNPTPPRSKTMRDCQVAFPRLYSMGLLSVEFVSYYEQPLIL
ncbi:hypothetical protein FB45DRAFT_933727 [Roridomyces roridus]|uniref:Uncharacterized protein n=1 Tax=Roridomyces roridus TaxID=1738132 RepID=A0AAD7FDE0_9AGAR|nr:hypothetical protein FB45DRAFT_933727 [Roridomyces roridus]